MTKCVNCGDTNAVTPLQEQEQGCQKIVHEEVCVQGTVTITPSVTSSGSRSFCVGPLRFEACIGEVEPSCTFPVSQTICVQIPLTFSALATAVQDGIVCGTAVEGPCPGEAIACTYSAGFFSTHEDVTEDLLEAAGGTIQLGDVDGAFSYTVSTLEQAIAILSINMDPDPPLPADNPQYRQLYRQLLAAKLNVLRLQGLGAAICGFATTAIDDADTLLANPVIDTTQASEIQGRLNAFNTGTVDESEGCPPHCPDDEDGDEE